MILQKPSLLLIALTILLSNSIKTMAFMDGINQAINNFGDMLNTIGTKMETVFDGVKMLEDVLTQAIEEECEFECANGKTPIPNPVHEASPNGCGSLGLKWDKESLPIEQLNRCCNRHDICYDTCNKKKEFCDKKFKTCLYHICDIYKDTMNEILLKKCKGAAKLMFTGTTAFGCKSYKDAQSKACLCKAKKHEDL